MIVSHTHKYLFIKSIKTAGTSIEAALSNYCSASDVVTPLNKYSFNRDEKSAIEHRAMNAETLSWWNRDIGQHVDALTMRRFLKKEWKEYQKISITRNPWARAVSLFFWRTRNDSFQKPKQRFYHRLGVPFNEFKETQARFSEFIKKGDWETNDRFYIIDGELCVDLVIKYENLLEDFRVVCDSLGIPRIDLPRLKTGIRPANKHYSRYYDDETKEIVAERHKNDIRFFGYEFRNA